MIQQVKFELERYAIQVLVDSGLVVNLRFHGEMQYHLGQLVLGMEALFLKGHHVTRVEKGVKWPATAWDHIKYDWCPEWIIKHGWVKPVLWHREEVVAEATTYICPHIKVPDQHAHLMYLLHDPEPEYRSRGMNELVSDM